MTVQTVLDPTSDLVEQARRVLPGEIGRAHV
jgi:hypothetical protein